MRLPIPPETTTPMLQYSHRLLRDLLIMKHIKKHISCTIMIVFIVAFDQITKYFASLKLADGSVAKFIPGVVQFKYAENTGMAFSMLSGARWVFIALTVVVCVGVFYYLFSNRCKNLWLYSLTRCLLLGLDSG